MRPWLYQGALPLLGDLAVPGYYFWLAMGFIAASGIVVREARRSGVRVPYVLDLAFIVLVGSLVGARLGHIVFENPQAYIDDPIRLLQIWKGGYVLYGGLIFNVTAMAIYIRWRRMGFWKVADVYAPAVAIGFGVGRLGCLSAGCCFGRPADWPFGFQLPWGVTLASSQVPADLRGVELHPTQAYLSLLGLGLFLWTSHVRRHQRYHGQAFLHLIALYAVGRSLIELFRFDLDRGTYLGEMLSTSQLISVPLLISALVGMRLLSQRVPIALSQNQKIKKS